MVGVVKFGCIFDDCLTSGDNGPSSGSAIQSGFNFVGVIGAEVDGACVCGGSAGASGRGSELVFRSGDCSLSISIIIIGLSWVKSTRGRWRVFGAGFVGGRGSFLLGAFLFFLEKQFRTTGAQNFRFTGGSCFIPVMIGTSRLGGRTFGGVSGAAGGGTVKGDAGIVMVGGAGTVFAWDTGAGSDGAGSAGGTGVGITGSTGLGSTGGTVVGSAGGTGVGSAGDKGVSCAESVEGTDVENSGSSGGTGIGSAGGIGAGSVGGAGGTGVGRPGSTVGTGVGSAEGIGTGSFGSARGIGVGSAGGIVGSAGGTGVGSVGSSGGGRFDLA